jgi:HKD family nuclease
MRGLSKVGGVNMILEIIDNARRNKLADKIYEGFYDADDVKFAVAYVSERGWRVFSEAVESNLSRPFSFEIIIGLSDLVTDPVALEKIYVLAQENDNVDLYCYFPDRNKGIFHPKTYLFIKEPYVKAFIGSSNLTAGGLKANREMNVMITANIYDEFVSRFTDSYNRIKFSGKVVIPDDELLSLYRETYRRVKTPTIRKEIKHGVATLRAKAASLASPEVGGEGLFGWSKLVFDKLPRGAFSTSDLYVFENEFAAFYPENKNIKAKIRQQLQYLRDLGLVKHVRQGVWRR